MEWMKMGGFFKYDPSNVAAYLIGMDDAERLRFYDSFNRALLTEEEGVNPYADALLRDRADYLASRTEDGKRGAGARWGKGKGKGKPKAPHSPPMAPLYPPHSPPMAPLWGMIAEKEKEIEGENNPIDKPMGQETHARAHETATPPAPPTPSARRDADGPALSVFSEGEDGEGYADSQRATPTPQPEATPPPTPPTPTDAGRGDRGEARPIGAALTSPTPTSKPSPLDPVKAFLANPKEGLWELDPCMLPKAAAAYCGEARERRTVDTFTGYAHPRQLGTTGFREVLSTFISECTAGEEPENRGAALTAKLREALEAKKRDAEAKAKPKPPTSEPTPEATTTPPPQPAPSPLPAVPPPAQPEADAKPEPEDGDEENAPLISRFWKNPLKVLPTIPAAALSAFAAAWEGVAGEKEDAEMDSIARQIGVDRFRAILAQRIRETQGGDFEKDHADNAATLLSRLRAAAVEIYGR